MVLSAIDKDVEDRFYGLLKDTDVARKTIEDYYPQQSIAELAQVLAEGMGQSRAGRLAKEMEATNPESEWYAVCKAAFERAMLRLLNEVAAERSD